MSPRSLLPIALGFSFAAFLLPDVASAQRPPMRLEPFEASGTVEAVAPGRIQMATNTQQNWVVFVSPKTTVRVTGTAVTDMLKPGMFVYFDGEIDAKGALKDKITSLSVFTPTMERPVGLFPAGFSAGMNPEPKARGRLGGGLQGMQQGQGMGPGMAPGMGPGMGPGANPGMGQGMGQGMDQGAGQGLGGDGNAGGRRGGKRGAAAVPAGPHEIRGRVTQCKGGHISISYGRTARGELAEDATINIESSDYRLASKGDSIDVKGQMMPGRMGVAQAVEVTIQLANPLGEAKKKPAAEPKPVTRKPGRGPAKQGGDQPFMPADDQPAADQPAG